MVVSCCAYGCTARFEKGSGIGFYRFPSDKERRERWIRAIRRKNWKGPTVSTRVCGQHFQFGRPSHDKDHPDYVPNVFIFNQGKNSIPQRKKNADLKDSQRVAQLLQNTTNDVTGLKWLKLKRDVNDIHSLPQKAKKRIVRWPTKHLKPSCHSIFMKENSNSETREAETISNNDQKQSKDKEIRPALPQKRVWILNIKPAKKNPVISTEKPNATTSSFASVSGKSLTPIADSSVFPYKNTKSDFVQSVSDDSTLTADSPIPEAENAVFHNNDLSSAANEDSVVLGVNSSVSVSEKATCLKVELTEKVTKDALDCMPVPTINRTPEENTEYDYSFFKCSPLDTKEDLAIKLETMLAVNIALQGKIKFYQNKCKKYEQEIMDLTNVVKTIKINNSVV